MITLPKIKALVSSFAALRFSNCSRRFINDLEAGTFGDGNHSNREVRAVEQASAKLRAPRVGQLERGGHACGELIKRLPFECLVVADPEQGDATIQKLKRD